MFIFVDRPEFGQILNILRDRLAGICRSGGTRFIDQRSLPGGVPVHRRRFVIHAGGAFTVLPLNATAIELPITRAIPATDASPIVSPHTR